MMKPLVVSLLLAAQFALAPPALAADDKKPATPQQQRMRDCNKEAEGMKGQERKDFMKQCLSGKQAENKAAREERRKEQQEMREERQAERKEARTAQQERMKACNADAAVKGLKGDARKSFMSDCLKN
jgi:hypothetical protein